MVTLTVFCSVKAYTHRTILAFDKIPVNSREIGLLTENPKDFKESEKVIDVKSDILL